MNPYREHFEREMNVMKKQLPEGDQLVVEDYLGPINAIIDIFNSRDYENATSGYYGAAIGKTIQAALGMQVLSPILGTDDEWKDVSIDGGPKLWQNIRDSGIFKEEDGRCLYNSAIVWNGGKPDTMIIGDVQGVKSSHYIKHFPFLPKTFYVDVVVEKYDETNLKHKESTMVMNEGGMYAYRLRDITQLHQVFTYYNKNNKPVNKEEDEK